MRSSDGQLNKMVGTTVRRGLRRRGRKEEMNEEEEEEETIKERRHNKSQAWETPGHSPHKLDNIRWHIRRKDVESKNQVPN